MSPLLVVTGTGTEIGKTHTACALASAWGRSAKVAAVKPIESGGTADGDALGRVSTFHVTRCRAPYMYANPVSPHLAGRREGRPEIPYGVAIAFGGLAILTQRFLNQFV